MTRSLRGSDGVPLYVEQLADSTTRTAAPAVAGDQHHPAPTHQLLQARLDSTGASKRVAQLAATIGREFEPAIPAGLFAERLHRDGQLELFDRPVTSTSTA